MSVKYVGATRDFSGYGEAARHDIAALLAAGVDVTVKPQQFTLEIADFGDIGAQVAGCENKEIDYQSVILHVTPNIFGRFVEEGKRIIGRVFWETDRLPQEFATQIEKHCHEVWTGSEFNAEAIKKSGVTKPVFIIPQAIDTTIEPEQFAPYITGAKGTFSFYSIFEWTLRKNPLALLEAYWMEFQPGEKVSLTVKTYLDNFTPDKRAEIDAHLEQLKARLGQSYYAPVYLARNLMDRNQIYRFHRSFDCFVSAHRGEGWGLPQMEALLMGNPVISTNCGGIHEYLEDGRDAILLPYKLIPLAGNNRNQQWYEGNQNWADVEIPEIRKAMRKIFDDQEKAVKIGQSGSRKIREKMSLVTVGEIMQNRLEGI